MVFQLGRGQVIKGWDEGVAGMKVGGKRQLQIPPSVVCGVCRMQVLAASSTLNATLIFDVELLDVGK